MDWTTSWRHEYQRRAFLRVVAVTIAQRTNVSRREGYLPITPTKRGIGIGRRCEHR